MLASFVAIVIASQKGIDLQQRVVRVPELVAELATKSSEALTAAANLKNEVVYVNLRSRGVAELMKLIAEVTGCEWIKREGRLELTRTSAKLREDEAREKQWDLDKISRAISKQPSPPEPLGSKNADEIVKKMQAIFSGAEKVANPYEYVESFRPVRGMLSKILSSQPPAWVLSTPYGGVATFVEGPNRLQKTLPVRTAPLMRTFTDGDRILRAALAKAGENGPTLRGDALGYLDDKAADDLSSPLTPYIVVKRYSDSYTEVCLRIINESGRELVSASKGFSTTADETDKNLLLEVLPANELLPLDPAAPKSNRGRLTPKRDEKILEVLRKPLEFEPLKVTLEKPFNVLFQKADKEAILSLADELATSPALEEGGLRSSELIRVLHYSTAFEVRGNLILGRPRHPYFAWITRADRAALQSLIARSPFGPPIPLDSLAEYVSKQTMMAGNEQFEILWLSRAIHGNYFADDLRALDISYGAREGIRLWAGLSKLQKDLIRSGGDIDIRTLSTPSKSALNSIVFEREVFLDPSSQISTKTPISVLIPNGLPSDAYLHSSSRSEPSVVFQTKDGAVDFNSASSAAYVQSQQEHQQFLDPNSGYLVMEGALYRPLQVKNISVQVKLTPEAAVMVYLTDYAFDPNIPSAAWQDLKGPEGAAFKKTLEYYRKILGGG